MNDLNFLLSLFENENIQNGFQHFLQHAKNIRPNEFNTKFNEFVSDTDEPCSICHEIMASYIKTECNHRFHKECLRKWLFESNNCTTTCPTCRAEINTSNYSEEKEAQLREQVDNITEKVEQTCKAFEELFEIINGIDIFQTNPLPNPPSFES